MGEGFRNSLWVLITFRHRAQWQRLDQSFRASLGHWQHLDCSLLSWIRRRDYPRCCWVASVHSGLLFEILLLFIRRLVLCLAQTLLGCVGSKTLSWVNWFQILEVIWARVYFPNNLRHLSKERASNRVFLQDREQIETEVALSTPFNCQLPHILSVRTICSFNNCSACRFFLKFVKFPKIHVLRWIVTNDL